MSMRSRTRRPVSMTANTTAAGAGYRRHRRDDGGRGGECDHRVKRPLGEREVERVLDRRWPRDEERALAKIIQHQRGCGHRKPRDAYRASSEMTDIGIQRFGT